MRQIEIGQRQPAEIGEVRGKPDQPEQNDPGDHPGGGDGNGDGGDHQHPRAGGEIAQSGVAAVRRWHSQKLLVWEVGLFGGCRRLAQQAAER